MNSPDPAAASDGITTPAAVDVFEQAFDGDSLFMLRHGVGAHAGAFGLGDEQIYELMLVAQELACNAVRHGPGHGTLRLWRDTIYIYCEVSNPGAAAVRATGPDTTAYPTDAEHA